MLGIFVKYFGLSTMEVFNKFFNYLPLGPLVGVLSRHDRVGNLGPPKGTRNQVGIGFLYRPASLCSLLLNSKLDSWNRFLAP
jgi:hypothetical protein